MEREKFLGRGREELTQRPQRKSTENAEEGKPKRGRSKLRPYKDRKTRRAQPGMAVPRVADSRGGDLVCYGA